MEFAPAGQEKHDLTASSAQDRCERDDRFYAAPRKGAGLYSEVKPLAESRTLPTDSDR